MKDDYGILGAKIVSLGDVASRVPIPVEDQFIEYGVRWSDGELAPDVLELVTDGYYDGDDERELEGKTYSLAFSEETVSDVLAARENVPKRQRLNAEIHLRYYIEFDAFLFPDHLGVGGFWRWGGGSRSEKREPQEFYDYWSKQ